MSDRLLIDMDGVLADTMGGAFSYVTDRAFAHEDVKDYWFSEIPEKHIFFKAFRSRGFYTHLDIVTGAMRGVNRLREEYDVVVCSAPIDGADYCEEEKRDWLEHHFDREFAEKAIIVPDKKVVPGKAIIEDNPFVEGPWKKIMFDQPYNRDVDYPRMYGWHDLGVVRKVMSE